MEKDKDLVEFSAIIPTLNREEILFRTLQSFAKQDCQPKEIIIVDASPSISCKKYVNIEQLKSKIIHVKAIEVGAAKQRNQAIKLSNYDVIGFFDDDILFEADCIKTLWNTLNSDNKCGGVNSVITNQTYHSPGVVSSFFYNLMGADTSQSLAGKCIGPAINFWPDANSEKIISKVDWLFSGCTLYKKLALPSPVFDEHFIGYSLMEDLALSLRVGKNWTLLNNSKARIYHDSQPGNEKDNIAIIAEMDLINRYYIMKNILMKTSVKDKLLLLLQQMFGAVSSKKIFSKHYLGGKYSALKKIRSI